MFYHTEPNKFIGEGGEYVKNSKFTLRNFAIKRYFLTTLTKLIFEKVLKGNWKIYTHGTCKYIPSHFNIYKVYEFEDYLQMERKCNSSYNPGH